jgi:hypothetical protein
VDIRLEVISKTESRRISDGRPIPNYILMFKINFQGHPIEGNFVVQIDEESTFEKLLVGQVLEGQVS